MRLTPRELAAKRQQAKSSQATRMARAEQLLRAGATKKAARQTLIAETGHGLASYILLRISRRLAREKLRADRATGHSPAASAAEDGTLYAITVRIPRDHALIEKLLQQHLADLLLRASVAP